MANINIFFLLSLIAFSFRRIYYIIFFYSNSRPENIYYDLNGMLRIKQDPLKIEFDIIEAKDLLAADTDKSPPTSDPYVKAMIVNKRSLNRIKALKIKETTVKKRTLEPQWNESFSIEAGDYSPDNLALLIKVYDADLTTSQCLGRLRLPMKKYFPVNLPNGMGGSETSDGREKELLSRTSWYDLEWNEEDGIKSLCDKDEMKGKIRITSRIVMEPEADGRPPLVPRQQQLNRILKLDHAKENFDITWCVIEANWINAWLASVHFNSASPSPGSYWVLLCYILVFSR